MKKSPTKRKPTKRVVKGWAVVDTVLAKAHGAYLVFNPSLSLFSLAIFTHPSFAEKYAKTFKGKLRLKIIEVDITCHLPPKTT